MNDVPKAVRELHLRDVRSFVELDLELGDSVLIIGQNGTNKTTILRALAVALVDASSASALLSQSAGSFVRSGGLSAMIDVTVATELGLRRVSRMIGTDPAGESLLPDSVIDTETEPGSDRWLDLAPVFGYGAARGAVGRSSLSERGRDSFTNVVGLFDYQQQLEDPELTLRRLRDWGVDRYESFLRLCTRLLDLGESRRIEVQKGGGITLTGPGGDPVPLAGWADGHRITFSWLTDLFGRAQLAEAMDRDGEITGVLLVDEVDQHLHPTLQIGVFRRLREMLPRMQIVATTHSPLVALGADPADLVVLSRHGDRVDVAQSPRDYRGYTVEDMLADEELFDAPVRAPEAQAQLDRYSALAAMRGERTEAEEAELRTLAGSLLAEPPPPGLAAELDQVVEDIRRRLSS